MNFTTAENRPPCRVVNGWFDCRLRVDLNTGSIRREPIGEQVLHAFIGGRGLNDRVLFNDGASGL